MNMGQYTTAEKATAVFRCMVIAKIRHIRKGGNTLELTEDTLTQMAEVDIRTVDINELTDLREIEIDSSQPVEKKLAAFARQPKHVYVNRIGDYAVKVRFQESGATIDDKMAEYLRRMSEIYL